MRKPIIGLLPFYIELYDQSLPWLRERLQSFVMTIASELGKKGLQVELSDFCRVDGEFRQAINIFERMRVDTIVTLHPAYSPSLESIGALTSTRLPLIVLDTTPVHAFLPSLDPVEILYNHGIHGVQDMCSMLLRNGRQFQIEAGHWDHSDVISRVAGWARAAAMAADYGRSRIGMVGEPFSGMGDFAVSMEEIRDNLGITVVPVDFDHLQEIRSQLSACSVSDKEELMRKLPATGEIDDEVIGRAATAGLMIRKWIQDAELDGFTINFKAVDKSSGMPCMPFFEISQLISEGIGYAGEGDLITAALASTLARYFPEVSFAEMFCPDWKNDRILLSHMGEANLSLFKDPPLLTKMDFLYTDVGSTVAAFGCFKPGKAVMVNLAPLSGGRFRLIISEGCMADPGGEDRLVGSIRGWFQPAMPLQDYLAAFSRLGGTHHSVLVYGECRKHISNFGEMMGWDVACL